MAKSGISGSRGNCVFNFWTVKSFCKVPAPTLCSHQWYMSPCISTPSLLCVLLVFCPLIEKLLEGRDLIFAPHHFAFNTGLGKQLDPNHAVWSVVVKDLNSVIRLSACPNISFLNYVMG